MEFVRWERLDGTDLCDVSDYPQAKRSLLPLPVIREDVSALFDYTYSNDLAIICNLYPFSASVHNEVLTKSAIFAAKSFLEHTDMRDCGVPFYFVISNSHYDLYSGYFKAANIPSANLLKFDETHFAAEIERGLVNPIRYYCTRHESLIRFNKVIWTDADTHAIRLRHQEPARVCERILAEWKTSILTPRSIYGFSENRVHSSVKRNMQNLETHHPEQAVQIWKQIGEVVEMAPEFLRWYWLGDPIYDMRGYMVGFDIFRYNADFVAHTLKCYAIEGLNHSDEVVFELYLSKTFGYKKNDAIHDLIFDATQTLDVQYNVGDYLNDLNALPEGRLIHFKT